MPSITPELGAVALAGSGATWEWDKRRPTRCRTVVSCGIQSAATARTAELDGQLDEERRHLDEARRQLADTALQLQTARQEVHLPLTHSCSAASLAVLRWDPIVYISVRCRTVLSLSAHFHPAWYALLGILE